MGWGSEVGGLGVLLPEDLEEACAWALGWALGTTSLFLSGRAE